MDQSTRPTNRHQYVVDVASACSRLGTWGLDEQVRADLIAERTSDLAEQLRDPERNSDLVVLGRAVRTLFGDIGRRLTSDHVSTLPLAFGFLMASVGTLVYAVASQGTVYKISLTLEGVGFLILAIAGFTCPLAIRSNWAAAGSLVVASGTALGVVAIPLESETLLFAVSAKISLSLATIGFTALAAGLLAAWDGTPRIAGGMVLAAAGLIVFSEIGWALYVLDESLIQLLAALLTAVGAVLFFRFFGRLRFLPIDSQIGDCTTSKR